MTTREQDAVAERLAEKYGRAACQPLGAPDGTGDRDYLIIGMDGETEMEFVQVRPDGTLTAAEHRRRTQPPAAGYLVIIDGKVTPVNDLEDMGPLLFGAVQAGAKVALRARTSLTRDRELTAAEQARAVAAASEVAEAAA